MRLGTLTIRGSLLVFTGVAAIIALGNLWTSIFLLRDPSRCAVFQGPEADSYYDYEPPTPPEVKENWTAAFLAPHYAQRKAIIAASPPASPLLLVMCKDTRALAETHSLYFSIPWILPCLVPNTDLGSLYTFTFLGSIIIESEWQHENSWVGAISSDQIPSSTILLTLLGDIFYSSRETNIDVLSFYFYNASDTSFLNTFIISQSTFPIQEALLTAGENPEIIQMFLTEWTNGNILNIYSHGFMARPSFIKSISTWLNRILVVFATMIDFTFDSVHPDILGHVLVSYYFYTRGVQCQSLLDSDIIYLITPISINNTLITSSTSRQAFLDKTKRRRDYYHNPRNPDATPFIFITYHDEKDTSAIHQVYSSLAWANPYKIPKTWLEEFYFITNYVQDVLHLATTNTYWIGSVPWVEDHSNFINLTLIDQMIHDKELVLDGADVLVFYSTTSDQDTTSTQSLTDQLQYILISMGEDPDKVSQNEQEVHSNGHGPYFVANLALTREFIPWISRIIILIQSDPTLREMRNLCRSENFYALFRNGLVSYFYKTRGRKVVSMNMYENILQDREHVKNQQNRFDLENSQMMESLSRKPDGTPVVFILCHSQDSRDKAHLIYSGYNWANIYILRSTFMLETYFYTNIMGAMLDSINPTTEWIGSISHAAYGKTHLGTISKMLSDQSLVQDGVDVLGFWDALHGYDSVRGHTNWFHPGLMELIDYALLSIGETQKNISLMGEMAPTFNAFYGTYFVCRPPLMRTYISWLSRVVLFVNTDIKAQHLVWKNAHYFIHEEGVAERVYGIKYYPLHPFLGERLSSYFFNSRGAKIVLMDEKGNYTFMKTN